MPCGTVASVSIQNVHAGFLQPTVASLSGPSRAQLPHCLSKLMSTCSRRYCHQHTSGRPVGLALSRFPREPRHWKLL